MDGVHSLELPSTAEVGVSPFRRITVSRRRDPDCGSHNPDVALNVPCWGRCLEGRVVGVCSHCPAARRRDARCCVGVCASDRFGAGVDRLYEAQQDPAYLKPSPHVRLEGLSPAGSLTSSRASSARPPGRTYRPTSTTRAPHRWTASSPTPTPRGRGPPRPHHCRGRRASRGDP